MNEIFTSPVKYYILQSYVINTTKLRRWVTLHMYCCMVGDAQVEYQAAGLGGGEQLDSGGEDKVYG